MNCSGMEKLRRIENALKTLSEHEQNCRLCPRECGVNRKAGQIGFCGIGFQARISHALLHYGEEPVLSGSARQGSGTVFFSGCSLKCSFCQNYQISRLHFGIDKNDEELAQIFLSLQQKGALNINLVTPSHVLLPVLRALHTAIQIGLTIPLVYNSSGYEKVEVIKQLEGIIDIYLPDLKYSSSALGEKLSRAHDYFEQAGPALIEMYCQQPLYCLDQDGLANKGLIIRHLVLPGQSDDSIRLLSWTAKNLSLSTGLSLMSQYHPCYKAEAEFEHTLTQKEYRRVLEHADKLGFENIFTQPDSFSSGKKLMPDFNNENPFKWGDS